MTDHITKLAEIHANLFLSTESASEEAIKHAELTANIALGFAEWEETPEALKWKLEFQKNANRWPTTIETFTKYLNQ